MITCERRPSLFLGLLAGLALALGGCSDDEDATAGSAATEGTGADSTGGSGSGGMPEDPPANVAWPNVECDVLVPSYCAFPFPSNVYTVPDPSTPTGLRLSISQAMMPVSYYDVQASPEPWSTRDGFSPGLGIMVQLPNATETGLPTSASIELSVGDESPTVLLRADNGERVPHFSEFDKTSSDPDNVTLFIRPAVRLDDATRYIVAIRNVVDSGGEALPPSEAFAALRDGTPSEEASIDERRPLYTDIFARLDDAGVERSTLQLSWDFTTASEANNTEWMVHMRDDALEQAGAAGPAYTITSVDTEFDDHIAFKVDGTFTAPMYLDNIDHGGLLQFGEEGLPESSGTIEVPFTALIPNSAVGGDNPATLLQYGHGFLNERNEIERDHLLAFADNYNYVFFATDWIGLTTQEQAFLGAILTGGELGEFASLFGRLSQSMVNQFLLMRMMTGGLAADPMFAGLINPDERYYYGISLGGINGSVYLSLSPDVDRAVLDVPGAPIGLILTRAALFNPFLDIGRATYPDSRDVHFVFGLAAELWTRIEPTGYLKILADSGKEALMRAAVGDHSVPTVSAHVLARSLGASHLESGVREVWGLEATDGEHTGLVFTEYDFGLPPEPICQLPNEKCTNPHGGLRGLEAADEQLNTYLRTGVATADNCAGGVCSFPELSGCEAGEQDTDVCQ